MDIQYRITSLDEVKYHFNFDYDYKEFDANKIQFLFSHILTTNDEKSELALNIRVKLAAQDDVILSEQEVRASFFVTPFKDLISEKKEEGVKVYVPEVVDTFANITVGALRGILAKNLKGTPLKDCILPLISMDYLHKMLVGKE